MKPAAGRDRHQPHHDAGGSADGGGLAGAEVVQQGPDHQRGRRGQEGVGEREGRKPVGRERAAAVEAEPAEPEQARTQQHERHVVREDRRASVVLPGAEDQRRDQGRYAGVDVHHGAAGEVERARGS